MPQIFRDSLGNVGLHIHDVRHAAIEVVAPKLRDVGGIDHFRLNADPVAALHHASRHDGAHVQIARGLARIDGLVFVAHHECARHDAQRVNLRQAVCDGIGKAVAQIIRIRTAAAVHERQHRNRVNRSARLSREPHAPADHACHEQDEDNRRDNDAGLVPLHDADGERGVGTLLRRGGASWPACPAPMTNLAREEAAGGKASSSTGARLDVRARSVSMSRCTRLRFARTSAALW